MKYLFLLFLIVALVCNSIATEYWQQEVHYEIDVELDDTRHMLNGFISIRYLNHSPYTLREIWMHLWPNAYRDN
ncbi:MAG: M1 family peptidase, partial [Chitinophagales bacterium]|nr:M1 family peptidase [Chitinophagales bacterium]